MTTPLRAAIVGPGRIASTYDDAVENKRPREFFAGEHRHPGLYTVHPVNHAEAYRTTEGYDLVAVVGRGRERLAAFQERWRVAAYDDLERMLAHERPEVVSVCTQSAQKAGVVTTIARAGTGVRAIVVEKAMATGMAETDAMIASCEDAGIELVVNHPYRFSSMVREARDLVDRGEIGALGTLSGWSRGGTIHGGTHIFDLLRYLGGDIVEVTSWAQPTEGWSDGGVSAMVRFGSGATGFVSLERDAMPGVDIRGASGAITLSTIVGDSWIVRTSRLDPGQTRGYPLVATREPLGEAPPTRSTTQQLLVDLRAALDGGPKVASSGQDGAAALEVGIAALISAKERRAVTLPLDGAHRDIVVPNR